MVRVSLVALMILGVFEAHAGGGALPPLPSWLPADLAQMMETFGHGAAVEEARKIRVLSPEAFFQEFTRLNPARLGGGYNGVAFLSSDGRTIKVSHLAFFDPEVRAAWQKFRELPLIASLPDSIWEGKLGDGKISMSDLRLALGLTPSSNALNPQWVNQITTEAFGRLRLVRSTERELLGGALWRSFDPGKYPLPEVVTQDGLACIRPFGKGVPLVDVLVSEREGTALHRNYSMDRLWQQVVEFQDAAEQMLLHYGVSIDLVVPGNLVIYGTGAAARLAAIDPEIIEPTEETRQYYAKRGLALPRLNLLDQGNAIHWPLMPNHIVSSVHWALNYSQAVRYMQHYWKVDEATAIKKLAETRRWNIAMFPGMNHYGNIRQARAAVRDCQDALKKVP